VLIATSFINSLRMKTENQDQAVHRPGPAKQDNKKHKTGRHRSKGTLEILKKGI